MAATEAPHAGRSSPDTSSSSGPLIGSVRCNSALNGALYQEDPPAADAAGDLSALVTRSRRRASDSTPGVPLGSYTRRFSLMVGLPTPRSVDSHKAAAVVFFRHA